MGLLMAFQLTSAVYDIVDNIHNYVIMIIIMQINIVYMYKYNVSATLVVHKYYSLYCVA